MAGSAEVCQMDFYWHKYVLQTTIGPHIRRCIADPKGLSLLGLSPDAPEVPIAGPNAWG